MRPVSRAVDRLLRGLGIAHDVERVTALEAWPRVAAGVLGRDAASTRAVRADGDTLVIAVPTPAWASEVRLREAELLDRLARAAPKSGIRSLRTIASSARGGERTA